MINFIIHRLLSYQELKMTYIDSNIAEYKGYFENGERSDEFNIISKTPSRNCVLAYFPMDEYEQFKDQLTNTSIPRKERIKIMRYHSEFPLCNTGSFTKKKNIECSFLFRGNGTLVFFPETQTGNYSIISLLILYNKDQLLWFYVVFLFGFFMPIVLSIPFSIYLCQIIDIIINQNGCNNNNNMVDFNSLNEQSINQEISNNENIQNNSPLLASSDNIESLGNNNDDIYITELYETYVYGSNDDVYGLIGKILDLPYKWQIKLIDDFNKYHRRDSPVLFIPLEQDDEDINTQEANSTISL